MEDKKKSNDILNKLESFDFETQEFHEQEFKRIYDKSHRKVFNYIVKFIGSREDASDILQDVYLLFYNKIPELDTKDERIDAWLLRSARNIAMTFIRKNGKKYVKSLDTNEVHARCQTEEQYQKKDLQKSLEQFLANLTEKERSIFILHKMEGIKYKDLMNLFDISERTIKRVIRSIINKLRKTNLFDNID